MKPLLVIATKELVERLESKRFIFLMAIVLLLTVYVISDGVGEYHLSQGPSSPLDVFRPFACLFPFLGILLGIAMGFDLLTRKNEHSLLNSSSSRSTNRVLLFKGKAIGNIAALAVAMGFTFLIATVTLIYLGIRPGMDDYIRIGLLLVACMLYCTAIFAFATLTSTVSKDRRMATMLAVGILLVLIIHFLLSSMISTSVANILAGNPSSFREPSPAELNSPDVPSYGLLHVKSDVYGVHSRIELQTWELLTFPSPVYDFGLWPTYVVSLQELFTKNNAGDDTHPGIAQALLSKEMIEPYSGQYTKPPQASLLDSISYAWPKMLALVVESLIALGLAYVIFMRRNGSTPVSS